MLLLLDTQFLGALPTHTSFIHLFPLPPHHTQTLPTRSLSSLLLLNLPSTDRPVSVFGLKSPLQPSSLSVRATGADSSLSSLSSLYVTASLSSVKQTPSRMLMAVASVTAPTPHPSTPRSDFLLFALLCKSQTWDPPVGSAMHSQGDIRLNDENHSVYTLMAAFAVLFALLWLGVWRGGPGLSTCLAAFEWSQESGCVWGCGGVCSCVCVAQAGRGGQRFCWRGHVATFRVHVKSALQVTGSLVISCAVFISTAALASRSCLLVFMTDVCICECVCFLEW